MESSKPTTVVESWPVARFSQATIPTENGKLTVVVYRETRYRSEAHEHMAIVAGPLSELAGDGVLARVHSECWTGETLSSRKCDCKEQLERAVLAITTAGRGVVVYLRQEGRGIGLGNKIKAYALQEQGADTVEANLRLGFAPDLRRYDVAASILDDLGVRSVRLMTNNPDKCAELESAGITIVQRLPHWGQKHEDNHSYLEVKRSKMGHHL